MRNPPPANNEGPAFSSLLIDAIPGNHLVLLPDAPTFTIAAVSDDYLASLSLQREPLVGVGVFGVFFSDGRNQAVARQLRQSLTQVLQTRQPHAMADLRYEQPSAQTNELEGTTWRVINKPVIGPAGEVLYIINTVVDITTKVQLVEATQANRYLQAIINLFKEPMQVLQPVVEQGQIIDFRFTLTNQAYADYAHSTPQQLQGKRVGEVFPGYLETVSFTNPVETYQTGQPLTFEIHYDQDGLDLYNLMSTTKLDDEVVIHFTDFTRLRQLQRQLESKIEELNRSNESLQQFAYIASHDLQEPLRKIQSFGDLLQTQYAGPLGEGVKHLERMRSAAGRMSDLIRDLLILSRTTTHQDAMIATSLTEVVTNVLADLDLRIQETGAVVEIEPLPTVQGDPTQLAQLFQNLLTNALKFRRVEPSGAPVRLIIRLRVETLKVGELPPTIRPARAATAYHRIDVTDNGIGFDERFTERIFQIFQRLHGKNQYPGSGIGLAICERVAVNHGGAITATSQPGQGATFSVYLPV